MKKTILCSLFVLTTSLFATNGINAHVSNDEYSLDKKQTDFLKKFDVEEKKVILDLYSAKNCTKYFKKVDLESFYKKNKSSGAYKSLVAFRTVNKNKKGELLGKIYYMLKLNAYKSLNCENNSDEVEAALISSLSAYNVELDSLIENVEATASSKKSSNSNTEKSSNK